jgi:hypothetical protein
VSPLANGALPEESILDSAGAGWDVMLDNTTTQAEILTAGRQPSVEAQSG